MKRRTPLTAKTADKFSLYEASVQAPEAEVTFIERSFRKLRGRTAKTLREDFCGSGVLACRWVESGIERSALGLDLDARVLAWGQKNHVGRLPADARERIELRQQNVLQPAAERFDVCAAYNYSWWLLTERTLLLRYFEQVRASLTKDGIFYLDIFGGTNTQEPCVETTRHRGFTYVWEQATYNPIDASMRCHIHFRFKDGSELRRAFSYDWRMWTLPELRDLLAEAGFSKSIVYWEGEDEEGGPSGKFSPRSTVENELAWNAYVVALP